MDNSKSFFRVIAVDEYETLVAKGIFPIKMKREDTGETVYAYFINEKGQYVGSAINNADNEKNSTIQLAYQP